ncbi:MAG: amidohydrolase family protein [Bacteroidia bacterium]
MKNFKNITLCILYIVLFTINVFAQKPASVQQKSVLLTNATVHVGNGKVLNNAYVGFKNGVITSVGEGEVPTGFDEVINLQGKHVYPGIIAPNTTLGLREIDAVRATLDYAEVGNYNPNVRSQIAYNTDSKIPPTLRFNGVLLAQITPRGGVISGTSSIMELDGWNWEDATLKADDGIHMTWPRMYKNTGWWAEPGPSEKNNEQEKAVNEIKSFFKDAKAYSELLNVKEQNLKFEAMKGVFDGSKRLYITANSAKEILEVIHFKKEFNIPKVVIVGGTDAWLVTEALKENNVPVILNRVHSLPERTDDAIDLPFRLPYLLQKAGVLFCLNHDGDMEVMGTRNLPFNAGTAATYGLSKEEALAAITLNAAKILGIDNMVGSIEVGKHATLFVSLGDALDIKTNILEHAFIRGKKIDLDNHQKQLYEKYKEKYGIK